MTYEFTHNPQNDDTIFGGEWRDADQDRLEAPAMPDTRRDQLNAIAQGADDNKKRPNFLVRTFNSARNLSNEFSNSKTIQLMAKRFARLSGITASLATIATIAMASEGTLSSALNRTSPEEITTAPSRPALRPADLGAPTRPVARPTP